MSARRWPRRATRSSRASKSMPASGAQSCPRSGGAVRLATRPASGCLRTGEAGWGAATFFRRPYERPLTRSRPAPPVNDRPRGAARMGTTAAAPSPMPWNAAAGWSRSMGLLPRRWMVTGGVELGAGASRSELVARDAPEVGRVDEELALRDTHGQDVGHVLVGDGVPVPSQSTKPSMLQGVVEARELARLSAAPEVHRRTPKMRRRPPGQARSMCGVTSTESRSVDGPLSPHGSA
jgi:hypothetical protein